MMSFSHLLLVGLALFSNNNAAVAEPCPATPEGGCSVCGEGLCVTTPDVIFAFPGFPEVPCGLLEMGGAAGAVPIDMCPLIPSLIGDTCNCASERATGGTTPITPPATPAPVPAPVAAETPAPVPAPVAAETPAPVPAPVSAKTPEVPAPTRAPPTGATPTTALEDGMTPTSGGAVAQMTMVASIGAVVVASIVA